jgi:hypothetical protein
MKDRLGSGPRLCRTGAAESVVLDYLRGGQITVKGFAEARAECKRRIDALAVRLRKR